MPFDPSKPLPARSTKRVAIEFKEPSLTRQADRDSCDINQIMARFQKTGMIDHVTRHQASYGDFTGEDFKTSMDTITRAQTMFNELPSAAREKFHHDPAEFLDYVNGLDLTDAQTLDDLYEIGLREFPGPGISTTDQPASGTQNVSLESSDEAEA